MKNYLLIMVLIACAVTLVVAYVLTRQTAPEPTSEPEPQTSSQRAPEPEAQQPQPVQPTPPSTPEPAPTPAHSTPTITINNAVVSIEIADKPTKRTQGLSGRQSLPTNNGMLFVFDQPHTPSFWMYDMNFALDFVWIRDNAVVDITENVPPPTNTTPSNELPTYSPAVPADTVLEVNAGWVARNGGKNALLNQTVKIDE